MGPVLTGVAAPMQMADKTLQRMAAGGMYDHLGGGFHRYSLWTSTGMCPTSRRFPPSLRMLPSPSKLMTALCSCHGRDCALLTTALQLSCQILVLGVRAQDHGHACCSPRTVHGRC